MSMHGVLRTCIFCLAVTACSQEPDFQITLEVGEQKTVTVSTHCGFETLEIDVNGQSWTTQAIPNDAVGNPVEPAWSRPGGEAEMELTLLDEQTLSASEVGSGVSHEYHPDPNPPGCA